MGDVRCLKKQPSFVACDAKRKKTIVKAKVKRQTAEKRISIAFGSQLKVK
jgi:hypothetical protein